MLHQWKCPKCGKVIESLYEKQFNNNKRNHEMTHQFDDGMTCAECGKKVMSTEKHTLNDCRKYKREGVRKDDIPHNQIN